jgi:3-deoxy-manno-octulosonate cytidylyltransferase (CMP-KDO synthetase)
MLVFSTVKNMMISTKERLILNKDKKIIVGVIPARIGSEEIHAKVLMDLGGKTVIHHVYDKAKASKVFSKIIVAADHEKIINEAESFGAETVLTGEHVCGSDRCAEGIAILGIEADIVVNIQADEPFLNPKMLPEVVQPLIKDSNLEMSTLCCKFVEKEAAEYIFNVKVVKSVKSDWALYFSRSLIPFERKEGILPHYHHIGVYAFRADALQQFAEFGPSALELREGLEQLRALEHGFKIKVVESMQEYKRIAINTKEDLEKARKFLSK